MHYRFEWAKTAKWLSIIVLCWGLFNIITLNIKVSEPKTQPQIIPPAESQPQASLPTKSETPFEFDLPSNTLETDMEETENQIETEKIEEEVITTPATLRLDQRNPPSDEEEIQEISEMVPNIPIAFSEACLGKNFDLRFPNKTCANMPSVYTALYDNVYWQIQRTIDGLTFYLHGAYYDVREKNIGGPNIRILALVNTASLNREMHCQFWFDSQQETVTAMCSEYRHIWKNEWGKFDNHDYNLQPYLISCKMPEKYNTTVPDAVSLVETPCSNATNLLKVIYNQFSAKERVAVCVVIRELLKTDVSPRLIEWMELLTLMGDNKVFFYNYNSHPNVTKVMKHYKDSERAEIIPISLPGCADVPLLQYYISKLNTERAEEYTQSIVPLNDCLYKNMYSYEYIMLLNIGEIIVPMIDSNWTSLLNRISSSFVGQDVSYASYNIPHAYFLDELQQSFGMSQDVPQYMPILQNVYRTTNLTERIKYSKSFHDTKKVITISDQFPVDIFDGSINSYLVEESLAKVHNYRENCIERLNQDCSAIKKDPTSDTTVWKYKEYLIDRTLNTLKTLDFFA